MRSARPPPTRSGFPATTIPARSPPGEFVAWYNGHPDYADAAFELSCERAVVIGNGNVALDVARMLVLDPLELAPTDTADHALAALSAAAVKDVVILGRRGPAQATFTNPELRELGELARADVVVDAAELELDSGDCLADGAGGTSTSCATTRRVARPGGHTGSSCASAARRSRSSATADGPVTGLRVVRNRLVRDADGGVRAVATGEQEVIPCGLVIRSIGYRGRPLPGVPFDERRGLIRNDGGRVCDEDGAPRAGEYAAGWIKRGPSGVIGTNKRCATDTVARLLEDLARGRLNEPQRRRGRRVAAGPGARPGHVGRLAEDRRARARGSAPRRAGRG